MAYAKPAFITHLNANKAIFYDAKGQPTFQLDVYCNERNREKVSYCFCRVVLCHI